jgi:hypothetical protein
VRGIMVRIANLMSQITAKVPRGRRGHLAAYLFDSFVEQKD